jgi:hypothetical protein
MKKITGFLVTVALLIGRMAGAAQTPAPVAVSPDPEAVAQALTNSIRSIGGKVKNGFVLRGQHGSTEITVGSSFGGGNLVSVIGITDKVNDNLKKIASSVNPNHSDMFQVKYVDDVIMETNDQQSNTLVLQAADNNDVSTALTYDGQNHPQASWYFDRSVSCVLTIFSGPQNWLDYVKDDPYAPWIKLDGKAAFNLSCRSKGEYDHYPSKVDSTTKKPVVDPDQIGVWFNLLDGTWSGDMGAPGGHASNWKK